jgi:hypothetical protein
VEFGTNLRARVVRDEEGAPEPEVSEFRTRQVPEDDVPPEYLDQLEVARSGTEGGTPRISARSVESDVRAMRRY